MLRINLKVPMVELNATWSSVYFVSFAHFNLTKSIKDNRALESDCVGDVPLFPSNLEPGTSALKGVHGGHIDNSLQFLITAVTLHAVVMITCILTSNAKFCTALDSSQSKILVVPSSTIMMYCIVSI